MAIDVDTLVDARKWCNMKGLGPAAPIVSNSLYRKERARLKDYDVYGTMVQTNAMIAVPGDEGLRAMKRWEAGFHRRVYWDQGVIQELEGEICGVPGWVACHRNPHGQDCHCTGIPAKEKEEECIKNLFTGNRPQYKLYEEMYGKGQIQKQATNSMPESRRRQHP